MIKDVAIFIICTAIIPTIKSYAQNKRDHSSSDGLNRFITITPPEDFFALMLNKIPSLQTVRAELELLNEYGGLLNSVPPRKTA